MLFPSIPPNFADLTVEELTSFIEDTHAAVASVTADPAAHVSEDFSSSDLLAACRASTIALSQARAELASRPVETPALSDEEFLAEMATLAEEAAEPETDEPAEVVEDEPTAEVEAVEEPEDPEAVEEPAEEDAIVASAARPAATRRRPPAPAAARQAPAPEEQRVALTAAAGAAGVIDPGQEFPSLEAIAQAMQSRRRHFGLIPEGTSGEKVPIVRASWSDLYPEERKLGGDADENLEKVGAVFSQAAMKDELAKRRKDSLIASGGLCAPVTPYYQLQMLSTADRPVRAMLGGFNADRGGIRYARPAALSVIDTAVGVREAEEDEAGGTEAAKTCQVVECPPFEETDVGIIFHCLQFGNLGARTFPERVTQWNNLTLAAHARLAESRLLTGIDTASTQITAGSLGLGASSSLLGQYLAAASAIRSRHRMDEDGPLRLALPWWATPLLVSDMIRNQFQRFDNDEARITAVLRRFNIEPSFYKDSANGRGQVFGAQSDGDLLPFPETLTAYMYPEGSFLFLDGGTLELGLVRDSVLNQSNDFQIFGETFENVAFIGIESYAIESTICDSGTTGGVNEVVCPIDYSLST